MYASEDSRLCRNLTVTCVQGTCRPSRDAGYLRQRRLFTPDGSATVALFRTVVACGWRSVVGRAADKVRPHRFQQHPGTKALAP